MSHQGGDATLGFAKCFPAVGVSKCKRRETKEAKDETTTLESWCCSLATFFQPLPAWVSGRLDVRGQASQEVQGSQRADTGSVASGGTAGDRGLQISCTVNVLL